jgi:hypothetical protein
MLSDQRGLSACTVSAAAGRFGGGWAIVAALAIAAAGAALLAVRTRPGALAGCFGVASDAIGLVAAVECLRGAGLGPAVVLLLFTAVAAARAAVRDRATGDHDAPALMDRIRLAATEADPTPPPALTRSADTADTKPVPLGQRVRA